MLEPKTVERSRRSGKFHYALAIIGLVADLIGIGAFAVSIIKMESGSEYRTALFIDWRVLTIASLFYGWFVLSWIVIRKHFTSLGKQLRYYKKVDEFTLREIMDKFRSFTFKTVTALGIFTAITLIFIILSIVSSPLYIGLSILGVVVLGLLSLGAIFLMIIFLMPVIYEDMVFITILGDDLFTSFY